MRHKRFISIAASLAILITGMTAAVGVQAQNEQEGQPVGLLSAEDHWTIYTNQPLFCAEEKEN